MVQHPPGTTSLMHPIRRPSRHLPSPTRHITTRRISSRIVPTTLGSSKFQYDIPASASGYTLYLLYMTKEFLHSRPSSSWRRGSMLWIHFWPWFFYHCMTAEFSSLYIGAENLRRFPRHGSISLSLVHTPSQSDFTVVSVFFFPYLSESLEKLFFGVLVIWETRRLCLLFPISKVMFGSFLCLETSWRG